VPHLSVAALVKEDLVVVVEARDLSQAVRRSEATPVREASVLVAA